MAGLPTELVPLLVGPGTVRDQDDVVDPERAELPVSELAYGEQLVAKLREDELFERAGDAIAVDFLRAECFSKQFGIGIGAFGTVEEIAHTALFLASPASGFITGVTAAEQVIAVRVNDEFDNQAVDKTVVK